MANATVATKPKRPTKALLSRYAELERDRKAAEQTARNFKREADKIKKDCEAWFDAEAKRDAEVKRSGVAKCCGFLLSLVPTKKRVVWKDVVLEIGGQEAIDRAEAGVESFDKFVMAPCGTGR